MFRYTLMDFCKKFYVLVLVYCVVVSAITDKTYVIHEENGAGEYIGNIPHDLELPPSSSGVPARIYQVLNDDDKVEVRGNGDLYSKIRLDREKICPENPQTCVIDVEVGITSNTFTLAKIEIVINDLNDNVPRFPNEQIEKEISESAQVGAQIRLDSAIDPDLGENSIKRYELSSLPPHEENEDDFVPCFRLNVFEDNYGTKIPQLELTRELDHEQVSSYELLLHAVDGGNPELTGTATVVINVTDSNDNTPTFPRLSYVVSVSESTKKGYTIIQLQATDLDKGPNAQIEYNFPSIVSAADREIFNLDSKTGIITLKTKLDYEHKPIHHLTVEAKDRGTNPSSAYATVTIQVEDVNDYPPLIEVNFIGSVSRPDDTEKKSQKPVLIRENIPIGSVVAFVTITDKDTGINGKVDCRLANSNSFEMTTVDKQENRYLIRTKIPLDREKERFYSIEIEAWDLGSPQLTSSKTSPIEIYDVNDNRPKFGKEVYHLSVKETILPGEKVVILEASDDDDGINAEITYSAVPLPKDADVPFAIRSDTGAVYFKDNAVPLDAERGTETFRLTVFAADNGNPSLETNTTLVINVLDENDNRPYFELENYVFRVKEDAQLGSFIGIVVANDDDIDNDSNAKLSYQFKEETKVFSIKKDTGEIYFAGDGLDLDRETRQSQPYDLTVIAADHGSPPLNTTCTVEIYIVDVNDNPPTVLSPNVTQDIYYIHIVSKDKTSRSIKQRSINKNVIPTQQTLNNSNSNFLNEDSVGKSSVKDLVLIGSTPFDDVHVPETVPVLIATVKARDPDEGENGRVRFTIDDGNKHGYFAIDPLLGNIYLSIQDEQSLRNMEQGCHVLKLNVKDLGKPVQHTFGWANIYVTEDPPRSLNSTAVMKECMNNSYYPKQFLPDFDDVNIASMELNILIFIIAGCVTCLIIITLLIVVCFKCGNKKSRSYKCKKSPDYGGMESRPLEGTAHQDSLHHTGNDAIDNRSSYSAEWSSSQRRIAQEKEEVRLMIHGHGSEGSVKSHNSGKDSGTGDSMPSDAYHTTNGPMYRHPQYMQSGYGYQYHQPSQVNLPPQDDIITTDEESRYGGRVYYPDSRNEAISSKCTPECRLRGHGDKCWMPDSLQRTSSRMASFQSGEDADGNSLKQRALTPNSYQRYVDTRYINVPARAHYDQRKQYENIQPGNLNGNLDHGKDKHPPITSSHMVVHQIPHSICQSHAGPGQLSQPPYTQSPIPFSSMHYSPSQQAHGKAYVNLKGVTYEANGFAREEAPSNIPSSGSGRNFQSYPQPHQHYSSANNNYYIQYPQAYEGYATEQAEYYDDHQHGYTDEASYQNEFAATNLLLSPADTDPHDYMQRFDGMIPRDRTHHSYENVPEIKSQRSLKGENQSSNEDEQSAAKLTTIREELDADEVVAGIDQLLL